MSQIILEIPSRECPALFKRPNWRFLASQNAMWVALTCCTDFKTHTTLGVKTTITGALLSCARGQLGGSPFMRKHCQHSRVWLKVARLAHLNNPITGVWFLPRRFKKKPLRRSRESEIEDRPLTEDSQIHSMSACWRHWLIQVMQSMSVIHHWNVSSDGKKEHDSSCWRGEDMEWD